MEKCIEGSFASGGKMSRANDPNKIFQQNQLLWQNYGTHLNPMIVINGEIFKGQ
jgi:hypothetical protein